MNFSTVGRSSPTIIVSVNHRDEREHSVERLQQTTRDTVGAAIGTTYTRMGKEILLFRDIAIRL